MSTAIELIVIGGSAGCLPVIMQVLKSIPDDFAIPIVIIVHRQRNVESEMTRILSTAYPYKKIIEPDDKEAVSNCCIYLAPQNYHLLIEEDRTFSLDYSEAILFSRPSIDVTFESASKVYKNRLVAVLLSGANNDGTNGLEYVLQNKGIGIVQAPETAEYDVMPASAKKISGVQILHPPQIAAFISGLHPHPLI